MALARTKGCMQLLRSAHSLISRPNCLLSLREFSADGAGSSPKSNEGVPGSFLSGWVKSKLPSVLGGDREMVAKLENLSIDDYAESLKQARRMGAVTGWVQGASQANDPQAQGTLRLFETIIGAMLPSEKENLSTFVAAGRQRVAAAVGCTLSQVDDCIARYRWMGAMTAKMAQLKKEGKEMPKTIDEVEAMLGTWRQFKTEMGSSEGGGGGAVGGLVVPGEQKGAKGQACPLAGATVAKNTKCPATKKSFKSCCGKKLMAN